MSYDMRNYLKPNRLTIAMWDTAYMARRNSNDPFRDWDRALDDAKERGFNTIRIDALPSVIDPHNLDLEYTWPDKSKEQPFMPWMWINSYTNKPGRDLIEFIQLANRKNINLSLSSWWITSRIVPDNIQHATEMWIKLLEVIRREAGFDNIIFVDLCNEIPGFLPGYAGLLAEAGGVTEDSNNAKQLTDLAPVPGCSWNRKQLDFLKKTLDPSLADAQKEYPELKFTYSMNINPSFENVELQNLDVLDIHFFITDPRFDIRTRWDEYIKTIYETDENYKDFCGRMIKTIDSVGPMLRQKQRQQLKWGKEYSEKIGAPLVASEAWASWFYIDHADLNWEWLLEWCETAVDDAIEFGLWGITTNNYVEPHFELWKNVKWHQRINEKFLRG